MEIADAAWLNRLFNETTVLEKLEGISLFNGNFDRTESFINSFKKSAELGNGILWAILLQDIPIGFISIYDLSENPFFSYALFEKFRSKHLFSGVIHEVEKYISKETNS
ncbi:MAG: hypothetical protein NC453_18845 [Muribaculum sp.]|nr:hypothetical protein [Muribaculum sp.]